MKQGEWYPPDSSQLAFEVARDRGMSMAPQVQEAVARLSDSDVHSEWRSTASSDMHECRIERIWRPQGQPVVVEYLRDDAMRTSNKNEQEFLASYYRIDGPKRHLDGTVLIEQVPGKWSGLTSEQLRALAKLAVAKADELDACT